MRGIDPVDTRNIDIRLHGGEPSNAIGRHTVVHECRDAGVVYRNSNVTGRAFPVNHGQWEYSFGHRVETPDRTIVASGDTRPTDAVVTACDGCDVVVHEVYDAATFSKRPPARQAYHSQYHTSTCELGALATGAGPQLLLLVHQLYGGGADADLVHQVKARFGGRVVSAHDPGIY